MPVSQQQQQQHGPPTVQLAKLALLLLAGYAAAKLLLDTLLPLLVFTAVLLVCLTIALPELSTFAPWVISTNFATTTDPARSAGSIVTRLVSAISTTLTSSSDRHLEGWRFWTAGVCIVASADDGRMAIGAGHRWFRVPAGSPLRGAVDTAQRAWCRASRSDHHWEMLSATQLTALSADGGGGSGGTTPPATVTAYATRKGSAAATAAAARASEAGEWRAAAARAAAPLSSPSVALSPAALDAAVAEVVKCAQAQAELGAPDSGARALERAATALQQTLSCASTRASADDAPPSAAETAAHDGSGHGWHCAADLLVAAADLHVAAHARFQSLKCVAAAAEVLAERCADYAAAHALFSRAAVDWGHPGAAAAAGSDALVRLERARNGVAAALCALHAGDAVQAERALRRLQSGGGGVLASVKFVARAVEACDDLSAEALDGAVGEYERSGAQLLTWQCRLLQDVRARLQHGVLT